MEKEQEKHEWKLLFIFLVFSLIISVVAIFQLLDKVAELEVVIIEQTRILAEVQKVGG